MVRRSNPKMGWCTTSNNIQPSCLNCTQPACQSLLRLKPVVTPHPSQVRALDDAVALSDAYGFSSLPTRVPNKRRLWTQEVVASSWLISKLIFLQKDNSGAPLLQLSFR